MRAQCLLGFVLSLVAIGAAGQATSLGAVEPPPVDYVRDIKPIVAELCVRCHGAEEQNASLRLDSAVGFRAGGDSGPLLNPDQPDASRLVRAITGARGTPRMPPEGEPAPTAEQIALLQRWVREGAALPAEDTETARAVKRSDHWAFQPLVRPPVPASAAVTTARNPIDLFVGERLAREGMTPASEADRYTLIRRLSLDLIGLPPTIEEVDAFVADPDPQAYERLVERLLASPHFGERWARHWLDLARYADSNGFTRDMPREIWKYREWVIEALNRNQPFDQFLIEQLAGDLLPDATLSQVVATGFHRNTLFNEEGGTDPEQFRVERTVDRVNTTGAVFLGLTVGCAQCHDHKYDPVSQREYYQLFAFFNSADEPTVDVPSLSQLASGALEQKQRLRHRIQHLEQEFASRKAEFEQAETEWEAQLTDEQKKQLPFQVLNAVNLARLDRTPELTRPLYEYFASLPEVRERFPTLEEIHQLKQQEPSFPTTMVMRERSEPRETFVQIRGDFLNPGVRVSAGTPAVLPPLVARGSVPDRLDLARWLCDPRNPLPARVAMNRLWLQFFGRGLVETENDFGTQGTPPTHPELLDWLASEFIANRWDVKAMQRLLVTSATYRQSSGGGESAGRDPNNRGLARQLRVRLDSEMIRDSALAASGLLTRKLGGPSVYPPQPEGVFDFTQDKKPWPTATGENRFRRAMYTYLWRSSPYPALAVFDFPDANVTCTRRVRSNTPLQSLTLSNDATFIEFARGLADRVLHSSAADDMARLQYAFRLTLARPPQPQELQRLRGFLAAQRALHAADAESAGLLAGGGTADAAERAAWTGVARVLFNLDEFITRE